MNMNQGPALLPIDNDTAYINNIKGNKKYNKKKDSFGSKKEDGKKFSIELSSTIKKNKESSKGKRSKDRIKTKKGNMAGKTNNKKTDDKQLKNENVLENSETIENLSQDKKILNELMISIPNTNLNEINQEKETLLDKTIFSDQISDSEQKNIEIVSKLEESEDGLPLNITNENKKNSNVSAELISKGNRERLVNDKKTNDVVSFNIKEDLHDESEGKKISEFTKVDHQKESLGNYVSIPEKNKSFKKNDEIELENEIKPDKKKNTSKLLNVQESNEKGNPNIKIVSENKLNLGNEIKLENVKNFGLHSNNVQKQIEINEISNIDHKVETNKILNKESISNIVKKIILSVKNNRSEIKIDLRPDVLGNIKIRINAENNHLKISIATETNSVKEIIENSIIHLKTDFQNNQIDLDKFDVFVGNTFGRGDSERRKSSYTKQFEMKKNFNDRDNDLKEQMIIERRSMKIKSDTSRVDYYV